MKISRLYGSRIERADGGAEGVILAVTYEGTDISGLIIADDNQREAFVPADGATFGRKLTYSRTAKKPAPCAVLRLGRAAFTEAGEFLGYLEDVSAKGIELESAKIGGKRYEFSRLVLGDIVIVRGRSLAELAAKDMFIGAVCG